MSRKDTATDRGDGEYRSLVLEGPGLHGKTLWALGCLSEVWGPQNCSESPKPSWRKPSKLRAELGPGQESCQLASKGLRVKTNKVRPSVEFL